MNFKAFLLNPAELLFLKLKLIFLYLLANKNKEKSYDFAGIDLNISKDEKGIFYKFISVKIVKLSIPVLLPPKGDSQNAASSAPPFDIFLSFYVTVAPLLTSVFFPPFVAIVVSAIQETLYSPP